MTIFFVETREQIRRIVPVRRSGDKILALTAAAMAGLDELGEEYVTPYDYAGLDFFVNVRRQSRQRVAGFCRDLDEQIRRNLHRGNDDWLEPAYWFNKFFYRLFQPLLSMEKIIRELLAKESPQRVVYFRSRKVQQSGLLKYQDILIGNACFLAIVMPALAKEFPAVRFEARVLAKEVGLWDRRVRKIPWHRRAAERLPWGLLRWAHAVWTGDDAYGQPDAAFPHTILRLGRTGEISMIVKCLVKQKGVRDLRVEDLDLDINPRNRFRSVSRFARRHSETLGGLTPDTHLFDKNDLSRIFGSHFPEAGAGLRGVINARFPFLHKHLLALVMSYTAGRPRLVRRRVSCVITQSGTNPGHNAVLAAARSEGIKTYIFQHGGDFGESHYYGEAEHTCFAFAQYFGVWNRNAIELLHKHVDARCEFMHLGRIAEPSRPQAQTGRQRPIKKILFVHNNAFHGYAQLMKDTYWYALYKRMVELFQGHDRFEYMLRPSPKKSVGEDSLVGLMNSKVPDLQICTQGTLAEVCAQADLVIIDCLSTTLYDALDGSDRVIGLKHETYVQYYPETEAWVRKICVLCQTGEEFLEQIEHYLDHPEAFPDFRGGIAQWKQRFFDQSSLHEVTSRFWRHYISQVPPETVSGQEPALAGGEGAHG